ncbi:TPA: glycosyltransferase family 2 protein, partial [Klebsiella pneumoniae subsp. pneumoniae]|nr:glycosyltransferase family 2 protein [Klebsiella pneumoniae subsp. pneumoniae]
MDDFISVVIPTYNSSRYIADTILSISDYYPEEKLDVILVDDCSEDVQDLKHVITRFNFVRLCEKTKKTNAADSRNIGIKEAKYNNVFLLDSDDFYTDGYLKHRVALMNSSIYGSIFFGAFIEVNEKKEEKIVCNKYNGEDIRDYIFLKKGDFRTSTISINKSQFKPTMFDSSQFKHQDWGFGIRAYDNKENIIFDDQPFVKICSGRHRQMSSKMNIEASDYFLSNYLIDIKYRLYFIRIHYVNSIIQRDKNALIFF